MYLFLQSSTSGCQHSWCQPVIFHQINCARTYYICIYLVYLLLHPRRGFCCGCARMLLVAILRMQNKPLLPPTAADITSNVGDLTTSNTRKRSSHPCVKHFWEEDKMRKHNNGGGWECLWCGFCKITDNHTKSLSRVVKVKLIGVNVSICVANIPDSLPARYQAVLEKIGARTL